MLLKSNLLETLTIVSCSGTIICILVNYVTDIFPITGVWFSAYISILFFTSLTFSFKLIQWLLGLSKPIKYDIDELVRSYPFLSGLEDVLPRVPKRKPAECKEYDTNELSVISTVLERKLVSSWYVPYVSQEIGFPFACKQMLDQMLGKMFQICNKIETKDVYIDMCTVLASHLNEYKKAMKRHEKTPTTAIEALYKKSHHIFNNTEKKLTPADHCTNVLRVIMKELVPWELWDTPHSELLVRMLAKKLDNFIESTLANPVWLNNKLMTLLKGENVQEDDIKPDEDKTQIPVEIREEKIEQVVEAPKEEPPKQEINTIESALSTVITKSVAPILPRVIDEDYVPEELECGSGVRSEPVDIMSSPVLRQKRGRQGKAGNEVKIYDRIIEGSVKTWETDVDLQCISLGQDLLASLNGELTLSRLWGQEEGEKNDQPLWFGEEDTLDMELDSPKNRSPVKKEAKDHSPKPTDVLLKDLQTTVHQAKTKIGDLQVTNIDVARNNDEAAGMMEGLLDFGIAGLKKGLRFTGLSDDSQEKSPYHLKDRSRESSDTPPPAVRPPEPIMTTLIEREDNNGGTVPHLVKQQRIASQDSLLFQARSLKSESPLPPLSPLPPPPDSPEPVYEEAADLSTSIAKLRCLLQQRAETSGDSSPPREEVWWAGAEETRGRTQTHPSSRPVDTATLADEYDINADRNSSPGQTTNNMQRLDKLFQRTVTGVFNSIKTAVGGDGDSPPAPEPPPAAHHRWTYVCTSVELSVGCAVARLVGAVRARAHVDAALDPLGAAPAPAPRPPADDYEEWLCAWGAGWCAGAEVCRALGLARTHLAHRLATLLLADVAESLIDVWLDELTSHLRQQVFASFENESRAPPAPSASPRELSVDDTCDAILHTLPAVVSAIFGVEAVTQAVRLSVLSFSHRDVTRDVTLRALDVLAAHYARAATQRGLDN